MRASASSHDHRSFAKSRRAKENVKTQGLARPNAWEAFGFVVEQFAVAELAGLLRRCGTSVFIDNIVARVAQGDRATRSIFRQVATGAVHGAEMMHYYITGLRLVIHDVVFVRM